MVAVFKGGLVPYILRSSEDKFSFIGDCYVHGIMNGEIMEWEEGRESRWFTLI